MDKKKIKERSARTVSVKIIENYSDIFSDPFDPETGQPTETLRNFLFKYIVSEKRDEEYKKIREAKGQTVGGLVSYEDIDAARGVVKEKINQILRDIDETLIKAKRKKILDFLKALQIESSFFKENGNFRMTDGFRDLCCDILDNADITDAIIHNEFDRISKSIYFSVYSSIYGAINSTNKSQEEKQQEIKKIRLFLHKKSGGFAPRPHNGVVDVILSAVLDGIDKAQWKPGKKDHTRDMEWSLVTEYVYDRLIKTGILNEVWSYEQLPTGDEVPLFQEYHLAYNDRIP